MRKILIVVIILSIIGCNKSPKKAQRKAALLSPVNLTHALSLVDSLQIGGETITFIQIYADAPDYKPIAATGEGITCVDDVGRFMEVLETEILTYNQNNLIPIARGMTRFLLYMSKNEGLWYNFMFADGTINTEHRNSMAEFGWWAVRGLRGLAAAYNIFRTNPEDIHLLKKIKSRIKSADKQIQSALSQYPSQSLTSLGMKPTWLIKNAPDMNSELLIALTKLHRTEAFDYLDAIQKIAEGLTGYQLILEDHNLNGMYICWENLWHNWGNNQAYGLMEAYKITQNDALLKSVKIWADHFIPFLFENDFPNQISIDPDRKYQISSFPQIAYGINSLYRGLKSLADITGNLVYSENAEKIFTWFQGQNSAQTRMYDPNTGRCYDGINPNKKVNLNSGAESTIECLLAFQARKNSA